MSILYKSTEPDSKRSEYKPNENVNFTLNFENQQIKAGSIRVCGDLEVDTTNATVMIDALTGIHGCVQSVITSFSKFGVVENLDGYPRLRKMKMQALYDDGDALSNSQFTRGLSLGRHQQTTSFLEGVDGNDYLPFCMKLDCLVNKTGGDICYSKTGDVKVNLRLASVNSFVSNAGADGYNLKNVHLTYECISENKETAKLPLVCLENSMMKHALNSNNMNLSSNVPGVVSSVACSFIKQSEENTTGNNNLKCERLPSVTALKWSFNDNFNLVQYEVKSEQEILMNYVKAMGNSDYNNIRNKFVGENLGWGVGLPFYEALDLSNKKISLEIQSSVNNAEPYSMFMYLNLLKEY